MLKDIDETFCLTFTIDSTMDKYCRELYKSGRRDNLILGPLFISAAGVIRFKEDEIAGLVSFTFGRAIE